MRAIAWLGALALTVGLGLNAGMASAHNFGARKADNGTHTYCSSESDDQDRARMAPFVNNSMDHLDNATDMTTNRFDCTDTIDVYWYVAPASDMPVAGALAFEQCVDLLPDNRCQRARIAFNKAQIDRADRAVRHTTCHEISHTVGSEDTADGDTGCWPQSRYSDDIYHNSHETGHINDRYTS